MDIPLSPTSMKSSKSGVIDLNMAIPKKSTTTTPAKNFDYTPMDQHRQTVGKIVFDPIDHQSSALIAV